MSSGKAMVTVTGSEFSCTCQSCSLAQGEFLSVCLCVVQLEEWNRRIGGERFLEKCPEIRSCARVLRPFSGSSAPFRPPPCFRVGCGGCSFEPPATNQRHILSTRAFDSTKVYNVYTYIYITNTVHSLKTEAKKIDLHKSTVESKSKSGTFVQLHHRGSWHRY